MKLMQRIIMVLLPLLLLFPTSLAYADMAPPPAPLLTGLEPFEYQDTHVQMVYERVELEVQDDQDSANGYSGSQVLVKASFVMRNRGKASESMQSIFPLESLSYCITNYAAGNSPSYTYYGIDEDSFEIQVNGSTVPTRVVTTPHPYHDTSPDTCTEMHWIGFDVSFPVDTDVVVTVSYSMQSQTADAMQNIDYVLETGAGWYGPIERAYVVAKFPYTVSKDNILKDTTPGYQTLYNEIFWAFQNFEPGGKDNIRISIVSPGIWESILSVRQKIEEDPAVPQNWLDLAQAFQEIAYWHGSNIRSTYYL
jgi:hypothetical protein